MMNSISMTRLAASVTGALGVEPPAQAEPGIPQVRDLVHDMLGKPADRLMIYNPDCIAMWLYQKYTERFAPVMRSSLLTRPPRTATPAVTPACFRSSVTGAMPAVHGIKTYAKPVIAIDSVFDAFSRAGKRTALVAVENSSMDLIFRNREIDYYSMPYDGEATEKGLELIEGGAYDVVVVYNQEYDDMIHKTEPESKEAMAALEKHIASFQRLTDAVRRCWGGWDSLVLWAPDHGVHVDWNGHGNHREFREEDINVVHFYGVYPRRPQV